MSHPVSFLKVTHGKWKEQYCPWGWKVLIVPDQHKPQASGVKTSRSSQRARAGLQGAEAASAWPWGVCLGERQTAAEWVLCPLTGSSMGAEDRPRSLCWPRSPALRCQTCSLPSHGKGPLPGGLVWASSFWPPALLYGLQSPARLFRTSPHVTSFPRLLSLPSRLCLVPTGLFSFQVRQGMGFPGLPQGRAAGV